MNKFLQAIHNNTMRMKDAALVTNLTCTSLD